MAILNCTTLCHARHFMTLAMAEAVNRGLPAIRYKKCAKQSSLDHNWINGGEHREKPESSVCILLHGTHEIMIGSFFRIGYWTPSFTILLVNNFYSDVSVHLWLNEIMPEVIFNCSWSYWWGLFDNIIIWLNLFSIINCR